MDVKDPDWNPRMAGTLGHRALCHLYNGPTPAVHLKPLAYRRCSRDGAVSLPRSAWALQVLHAPVGGARRPAKSPGPGSRRWLQRAGEAGSGEATSRLPEGWTPAPRAAAERSARHLLTGLEQRAANPAGGRGRAGGLAGGGTPPLRRAAAESTACCFPRPRLGEGGGRGAGRANHQPGHPSPAPGRPRSREPLITASPLDSDSHWLGHHRPAVLTCPADRLARGLPLTWDPARQVRGWQGRVVLGRRIGAQHAADARVALLPAAPGTPFFSGGGRKSWEDADLGKTSSPTPSGFHLK